MASNEPRAPVAQAFRRNVLSTVLLFLVLAAVGGYGIYVNHQRLVEFSKFRAQRSKETTAADVKICRKVDRLDLALVGIVSRSSKPLRPGDYGYSYQQAHPEEAKGRGRGVAQAVAALREAACNPNNLPSVTKRP